MADISAKDVMALRNRTGLPMMACKKALAETGGDIEAAEDHLRKTLKGKMETRTERAAAEGRVAVAVNGTAAAIVDLRAETDFTAKNDKFIQAADKIAQLALAQPEEQPARDLVLLKGLAQLLQLHLVRVRGRGRVRDRVRVGVAVRVRVRVRVGVRVRGRVSE